jgi:hypothetical protein
MKLLFLRLNQRLMTPLPYTVKISGTGNLSLIDAPVLQLPNGFEVYDPKVKEKISSGRCRP